MRLKKLAVSAYLVSIIFFSGAAIAAEKKEAKLTETTGAVAVDQSFDAQAGDVAIKCGGPIKSKYLPGTMLKNNKFLSIKQRMANLKKLIKISTGKKLLKYTKSQAKYKKLSKASKGACDAGPQPPNPTPTPEGTPQPVNLLDPYVNGTEQDVYYLYERAAFGAVPAEALQAFATGNIAAVVDFMTTHNAALDSNMELNAVKWLDGNYTNTQEGLVTSDGVKLAALFRMVETKNPFHERLAYMFLHNYLATSSAVLTNPQNGQAGQIDLFEQHFNLIRGHAITGDYKKLVRESVRDPAMLRWLSGYVNIAQEPNEDHGREAQELFSLGVIDPVTGLPNYTELDVAQAARLFAGWSIQRVSIGGGQTAWSRVLRDLNVETQPVTIYAGTPCEITFTYDTVTGQPRDQALMDHILTCKAVEASRFLAMRLATEYVNDRPSKELIEALATEIRNNDFNLIASLKILFKSAYFYGPEQRDTIIAMPTDRAISTLRRLNMSGVALSTANALTALRTALENTGHSISQPFTVFGWDPEDFANSQWQLALVNAVTVTLGNTAFNPPAANTPDTRLYKYELALPNIDPLVMDSDDVIIHFQKVFNVPNLSAEALGKMREYMNNTATYNAQGVLTLTPVRFDARSGAIVRRKIPGLAMLFFEHYASFTR